MAAVREPSTLAGLAIYMRVSSDEQRQQGTIETQRSAADRYLTVHDITPVGWYADDGVSGTVPFESRPEGRRLLADVRAGHVVTVLCYRLDRLGRNAREVLNTVHALRTAGAEVVSVTEHFDTKTPAGALQLNMLASIAEFERSSIVQRSEEGTARRLTSTTYMGGTPSYGYRIDGKKGSARLVIADTPDPACGYSEADVVHLIWHLCVEQDWTCEQIAARLDALDIPTRYQRRWSPTMVHRILTDDVYGGTRAYRDKRGVVHLSDVPMLLSHAQREQAKATLQKHTRTTRRTNRAYLLRGMLRCAECGELYSTSWTSRANGRQWRYYCCTTRYHKSKHYQRRHIADGTRQPTCRGMAVDAVELETAIWTDIEGFIREPGTVLQLLAAKHERSADDQDASRQRASETQAALDAVQHERDRILALYRRGRISERDLDHQLDEMDREQQQAEAAHQTALSRLADAARVSERLESARTLLQTLHARLDGATAITDALKRDVVEALIVEVRVETVDDGVSRTGQPKSKPVVRVTYAFDPPESRDVSTSPPRG